MQPLASARRCHIAQPAQYDIVNVCKHVWICMGACIMDANRICAKVRSTIVLMAKVDLFPALCMYLYLVLLRTFE